MFNDWLPFLVRASLLLLISGSCVALLSRIYPLASPRWHRLAWGTVLLQGLILVPFSLTVEMPEWLATHRFVGGSKAESEPESAVRQDPVLEVARGAARVAEVAAEVSNEIPVPPENSDSRDVVIMELQHGNPANSELPAWTSSRPHSDALTGEASGELDARLVSSHSRSTATATFKTLGRTSTSFASNIRWKEWLASVWICGVLGIVGFGLLNYISLNIALIKARPARRSWAKELQDLSLELNLDHSIALDVHPAIGPLICWTPAGHRIVVPVGLWSELSSEERVAVLHHELSHLRRGDLWKSMLARLVLALHWFNPLAWVSARRFDESAEWACDALMASERPARVTRLANALLAATTARDGSPILAMSATGGPLFQRIRRLVSWDHQGDTVMQKCVWGGLLCPLVCLGLFQLQFTEPLAAQTATLSDGAVSETPASQDESAGTTQAATSSEDVNRETDQESVRLNEITERIVVGDHENLKKFIALMKTHAGQIVMADRAALLAQNATSDQDSVSQWQQFVASHFTSAGSTLTVNADFQGECDAYVKAASVADSDVALIAPVFQEVAAALDTSTAPAQILQRLLKHEATPAFVNMQELRSRLHPGIEDLGEVFSEQLVRNKDGRFVIRPARRAMVEDRMKKLDQFVPMLKRFEEELAAWSHDLSIPDDRHGDLKAMLADPNFALYLASRNLSEDDEPNDEHFDDNFYWLEEATSDAPTGLVLNVESDQLKEIEAEISRFKAIQEQRSVLEEPLHELVNRLDDSDDLHRRLKEFLKTDLARMIVVREMDYSPVSADEAAREWLSYMVTLDANGKYTITIENPDELVSQSENYFQEFREIRRRGRTLDEFAAKLTDPEFKSAIRTLSGKLLLDDLVERSASRPDVDGLQLWFDAHFEETAEGLKLIEGASGEVDAIIEEAAQLEEQLSKTDF